MIKNKTAEIFARCHILVALFLVGLIYIAYRQVGTFDFLYLDDHAYVTGNVHLKDGLTTKSLAWAFTSLYGANWHPISWLSHMLDVQLYGLNPGSHHFTNLIFHITNTLLLFYLFKKMTGKIWQSSFVAVLFAIHPLHVESVVWIAERKDVLFVFFGLLTIFGYIRYVERPGILKYLLVFILFAFGLMAKPMLVTLPFVLLLLDYWPLERLRFDSGPDKGNISDRSRFRYRVWEKLPLFVLSALSCIITVIAQKQGEAIRTLSQFSAATRISNALAAYVKYIAKMFWPNNLGVLYPHSAIPVWQAGGALFFIILTSYLVFRRARSHPYLIVGWLWYLGTLFPVIGLLQVGMQAMADRYTYLPLIGLYIMFSWGVPQLIANWRYKAAALSLSALMVVSFLMFKTPAQARYWKNSITLFQHTISATDNNYIIHFYLAEAFAERDQLKESIENFRKALQIKPDCVEAHNGLGVVLSRRGENQQALKHLRQAVHIHPLYADAYNNLGTTLVQLGQTDAAIACYRKSISLAPAKATVHNNIGLALIRRGKINRAVFHFKQALKIDPQNAAGYRNLKRAERFKAIVDNAAENLENALDVDSAVRDDSRSLDQIIIKREALNAAVDQLIKALTTQPGFKPREFDIKNYPKTYRIIEKYNRLIPTPPLGSPSAAPLKRNAGHEFISLLYNRTQPSGIWGD